MNRSFYWMLLNETAAEWSKDKVPRLAAALAFYSSFAMAPLFLIAIAVAGLFFGEEAATRQIRVEVSQLIGPTAGAAVLSMLESAGRDEATGIMATVIGLATLLFAASGVFGELQDSLNTIWDIPPRPDQGWLAVIQQRFFSFVMVLGLGFLMLVSLLLSASLTAAGTLIAGEWADRSQTWEWIHFLVSFLLAIQLFGLIFKVLPDTSVQWSEVWVGAVVTAVLFTIGKSALGWYLGRPTTTSPYGAAGSFVALMLWNYYSAQVLFLGAEFTQVYANARRSEATSLERQG